MSRPGLDSWLSSIHGTLLFSPPRTQWTLPLSLTLDTRTIKYIWSEVWTCYFLKEMLCAFLGLPSFASSWDCIIWHSVCTTGRWDLLKASIVSDLSERAASCIRIGEENSVEVAHISTTFVRLVFSLVCTTSSYPIEFVTELSCLLFYISDFCLYHSFTTAHFSLVCFLPLSVSSGDQAGSTSNCRA